MEQRRGDLVDRLERLTEKDPERLLCVELFDGSSESARLTAADLRGRSAAVAAELRARGLAAGDVALLIASPPVECLVGLFGCLRAGVIAAPVAFPRRPEHLASRIEPVRANAGATAIVAGSPQGDSEREVLGLLTAGDLPIVNCDLPALDTDVSPRATGIDVAYLQYTSGSTSEPKGVIVTHANLEANLDVVAHLLGFDSETVIVNWNPLTHDMGMVMGALPAVGCGVRTVLMTPASFIRRPVSWLRAIHNYRGTHGYSPNFGFDLLVERTTPEDREALDLSSMRVWVNGAEAVRLRTRDRFFATFAPSRVDPLSWRPCYGLAEATVIVSATPLDDPGPVVWVDVAALENHRVVVVPEGTEGARALCADGVPGPGYDVVIVDEATGERLPPDRVGELWVRGPSVCPGYWKRPDATAETFGARLAGDDGGPWLRTGDLAFLHDSEIVICGRLKDLIVINGRNLHPQDIELVADLAHDGVRSGGTAAFPVDTPDGEAIVVLAEVEDPSDESLGAIIRHAVQAAVLREFEVRVAEVLLVGPRGVPKTSSGKVQRRASREIYERTASRT